MKTNLTKRKWIVLSFLFLMLFTVKGYSQANNYNCCIKNITQTSPSTFEFDVWLEWTGSNTEKLTFFQAGINFNYAGIANGGTMTGTFKAGSANPGLAAVQQAPNWNINATSKQIRMLAAIATPSIVASTVPAPPGWRLGTFVITNTVPFTTNSSPDFVWSYLTGTSTTTKTQVSFYLNGATTGTDVTIVGQQCADNIILNQPCPTANAGGPYTTCGDVHLNGTATDASSVSWTSSGTGTFDPSNSILNPTYHPSAADLGSVVTLTLKANTNTSGCQPASSSVTVNFTSISDGDACTVDGCDQSTGVPTHSPLNFNDGNACTNDACDPLTGPSHTAVNKDDGNPCTDDFCDTNTGVFHTATNTNDGNACTTDGCDTDSGVFHNAVDISDVNACTVDACDTQTGVISHTPVNVDDGNPCTEDECNASTGVTTHTAVFVDDGNACTDDACDPSTGTINHTPVNVDDGNACTVDACATVPSTASVTRSFNFDGILEVWPTDNGRTSNCQTTCAFSGVGLPVSGFPAGSVVTDFSWAMDVAHTWGGDIQSRVRYQGGSPFVRIQRDPTDGEALYGDNAGNGPPFYYQWTSTGAPIVT